jgi:hypothetical protein
VDRLPVVFFAQLRGPSGVRAITLDNGGRKDQD